MWGSQFLHIFTNTCYHPSFWWWLSQCISGSSFIYIFLMSLVGNSVGSNYAKVPQFFIVVKYTWHKIDLVDHVQWTVQWGEVYFQRVCATITALHLHSFPISLHRNPAPTKQWLFVDPVPGTVCPVLCLHDLACLGASCGAVTQTCPSLPGIMSSRFILVLVCTRILSLFTQDLFVSRSSIILNTKLKKYVPYIQDALWFGFKIPGQLLGQRPAPSPWPEMGYCGRLLPPASWESQKTFFWESADVDFPHSSDEDLLRAF